MPRLRQPPPVLVPLEQVQAFSGLPREALALVRARARPRRFARGQVLMRQGEPSECMYVILAGCVSLERSHPHLMETLVLAELGPGEVVGEMGLLDGAPRSATVVAIKDTQTLEVDAPLLQETIDTFPEVSAALLRILSRRLRSTNELAEHYLRQGPN